MQLAIVNTGLRPMINSTSLFQLLLLDVIELLSFQLLLGLNGAPSLLVFPSVFHECLPVFDFHNLQQV